MTTMYMRKNISYVGGVRSNIIIVRKIAI